MRSLAAATLSVAISLLSAPLAVAAPADVHVRIEGADSTLFDRSVRVDGHDVRAASDAQPHRCDGTNAHRNATPGPTATSAAVDALASLGQGFDGQWYQGLDDYFVSRLGPEREDNDKLWWWGLLVNRRFSAVGGCQAQLRDGDEVLWALDAFGGRPFLWLAGPATAQLGAPLSVAVSSTAGDRPTPGAPYAGAQVEVVDANGRPAAAGTADGGASDAGGAATVTFRRAGWQRLKARGAAGPGGHPLAIASNSVDVCVEATPGAGCGGAPPSARPVVAPAGGSGGGTGSGGAGGVRLGRPRLTLDRAHGRASAGWKVLDAGPGIRDWTIAAKALGRRGAPFVARAGGGPPATSALLRLPAGIASQLRLTVRDTAGHTTSLALGRVLVPRDDRTLEAGGDWTRASARGAWLGTVTRGRAGARLATRTGPGRTAFVVRSGRASAQVRLSAGGRERVLAIPAGSAPQTRQLLAPALARAGSVALTVLSGTVDVDGVALVG